ncbi:hypothetical protein J5U23_00041 [Saccharolobus shibatae B12]|uniref:Uncharacterized protein n=2 Tax=Saccharolobus shibatae TaxID=2286 RepID=A0A8F5BKX2_SACSH|nr:hypothetical protein J5U23_00041 [Saccharolobus shibatae B12]QXJ30408.1 hypothetical protein J5U21_00045 [Saccharolobus shibatae]
MIYNYLSKARLNIIEKRLNFMIEEARGLKNHLTFISKFMK